MAVRGVLAIAFGVSIAVWPHVTLSLVGLFFGVYAILDGMWTIGAGIRASTRIFDAWPVLLEGAVSVAECPVVPLTISGTRAILPAGAWLPRQGGITITIGAPIVPGQSARHRVGRFV